MYLKVAERQLFACLFTQPVPVPPTHLLRVNAMAILNCDVFFKKKKKKRESSHASDLALRREGVPNILDCSFVEKIYKKKMKKNKKKT